MKITKGKNAKSILTAACAGSAIALAIPSAVAQEAKASVEVTKSPFKGEFVLGRVASNPGDDICQRLMRNLNQFRKLDFDTCHPRLSEKYPEFTRPYTWQEIPFDIALAEKAIRSTTVRLTDTGSHREYNLKRAEERWRKWLSGTEALRAAGKVRMWTASLDLDGDGLPETVLRLDPGGRAPVSKEPLPAIWTCDYSLGQMYVIESSRADAAAEFNVSTGMNDLLRDEKTGRTYLLEWLFTSSNGRGYNFRNVGGTRGLVVYRLDNPSTGRALGPRPGCLIDWVPTGAFIPETNPQRAPSGKR